MTDIERHIWNTYYHLFDSLISIEEVGTDRYLVTVECHEQGFTLLDIFTITYPNVT